MNSEEKKQLYRVILKLMALVGLFIWAGVFVRGCLGF